MFAQVTFPMSKFRSFEYSIPVQLNRKIKAGSCVMAPFRNQHRIGFIISIYKKAKFNGEIKPIKNIHDEALSLPNELWQTIEWMSDYYLTPIGKVLKTAIPLSFSDNYHPKTELYVGITDKGKTNQDDLNPRRTAQKRILEYLSQVEEPVLVSSLKDICSSPHPTCKKLEINGFAEIIHQEKIFDPFHMMSLSAPREIILNEEQQQVYLKIAQALDNSKFSPFLMKGVTGSGKTEVYLKLAQNSVSSGKSVLVLVPEIALTPQVAKRFRHAFGNRVALWHSRMSKAEKGWTWQKLKSGKYAVVVGARSAVFAPLKNLGLIIIDEEQETSYKQEGLAPRYHARDVALMRGKSAKAVVLLTSATPCLESYFNGLFERYQTLELTKRFGTAHHPAVRLVDMKNEHRQSKDKEMFFSQTLIEAIQTRLERKEQIILLQNRRGFAPILQCKKCGYVEECEQCAVSLTYHRAGNQLVCHYCRSMKSMPSICPNCESEDLDLMGTGTQKVEDELALFFPEAKVIRLDTDTARTKGAHHRILEMFELHDADILLGTQMVAKGLDFANVTLVGVINADLGLFLPDFRSGERIFQLIYQVAGRAGRHEKPGVAIIQTYNPDDPYLKAATRLDIKKFYNIALAQRNDLFYPPFSRLSRLIFSGENKTNVDKVTVDIANKLKTNQEIIVLGPAPAPIERIQGRWRNHILIKSNRRRVNIVQKYIQHKLGLEVLEKSIKGVRVQIDIDPASML